MQEKIDMRAELRARRRDHVASIPESMRGLLFLRPPSPVTTLLSATATIGLYHAGPSEAPTTGYAKFFYDARHRIALPWFAARGAPMQFRAWDNPYEIDDLQPDPYGSLQPHGGADAVRPDVVFVPLIAFTADGHRLGQGGGHYDRWLAAHPDVIAIGLGWDCQLVDELPVEAHDRRLAAVVTPTRLYGPF